MATCTGEIHQGDIGTDFRITIQECDVVVDVSGATTQELILEKPDGTTTITRTTSFYTDGTDGIIRYKTVSGDLDQSGTWKIQAHVVLPTGEWWSDISRFRVYGNLG